MKALYEIENKKLQFFLGVMFSIVIPIIWGMLVVQFVIRDEYCKHTTLFYFISFLIVFIVAAILMSLLRKGTDNLYAKKKKFFDKNEKVISAILVCIYAMIMLFAVMFTAKYTNSIAVCILFYVIAVPLGYLYGVGCGCINLALGIEKYVPEVNN
ncbi:hypothetical protein [Anaerobutyricum hallii]|uniref:hypothetical protein n=1 Tax=Anaerobutyricum hallii TaxID=39488 RepID=UPI003521D9BC